MVLASVKKVNSLLEEGQNVDSCFVGQARAEEESDAGGNYPAEEDFQEEGRAVHLL